MRDTAHRLPVGLTTAAAMFVVGSVAILLAVDPLGWLVLAPAIAGLGLAVLLLRWGRNHAPGPSEPLVPVSRVQINFASVPVAANVAGLIFVVGSIAVVLAGLPPARWFFFAAAVGGIVIAGLLLAWHRLHPSRPGPASSLR